MPSKNSLALVILMVGLWSACARASEVPEALAEKAARTSSRDVRIPRALVQQLESEYRAYLTKNEVSLKENIKRGLLNISADLTQKRPIALHEDVRIVTPLGGGVVDLAEFVTPLRGAFRLKIETHKEDGSEPPGLRVFFVSKAKSRILDGDEYGAGCNKYMEITGYYHKKASQKGFELYTADQRYLSVLGGTFVAVAFEKESLNVASLSFMDSRYPNVLCD